MRFIIMFFLCISLSFSFTSEELEKALKNDDVLWINKVIANNENDSKLLDGLLFAASTQNSKEIVKLLIEKGTNIEAKDNNGYTAIMYASMNNEKEIVKITGMFWNM